VPSNAGAFKLEARPGRDSGRGLIELVLETLDDLGKILVRRRMRKAGRIYIVMFGYPHQSIASGHTRE
jgi:hypothetical protein